MNNYIGFLAEYPLSMVALGVLVFALALGFLGSPFFLWAAFVLIVMAGLNAPIWSLATVAALGVLFLVPPLRRALITSGVMKVMKNVMPQISETERTALEAGVVWSEADLFSGKPNFKKLMNEPYPQLTKEERDFVNGPVEELCQLRTIGTFGNHVTSLLRL